MANGKSFHHLALAVSALLFFLSSVDIILSHRIIALSISIFIGTFFIYRLSVWVPVLSWSYRIIDFRYKPNLGELATYLILLPSTFYFLNLYETTLLIGWGLFATCYFLNIKLGRFVLNGLRSIPLIKTIHLSLLWTIIGFIFKLSEASFSSEFVSDFTIRFTIIFLICLGVDLRDISKDQESSQGLKIITLATYFGFDKLKQIMLLVNLILIGLLIYKLPTSRLDLFISSLLFLELISLKINSSAKSFTILMDGTLLLYSFLAFMIQLTRF